MVAEEGPCEETKVQSEAPEFVDTSGFVRAFAVPEAKMEIHEPRLADLEKNGVYDRDAILRYLANLANTEDGDEIIYEVIRLNEGSTNSDTEKRDYFSKIMADEELSPEDRHYLLVDKLRETLKALPDSLLHLATGWVRPGDCGRPADQKPDWLDLDKLRRGQKFAQDNMFAVMYVAIVGLFPTYSFDDQLKPLIITGKTTKPFAAFKRVRRWYTEDIWDKETGAWKNMSIVRAMHLNIRKRLAALTNEEIDAATTISNANCLAREIMMKDFVETCEAPAMGQCPYILGQGNPHRPKGMNQAEMAITQWSFAGLLVSYPHRFGIHHATDEDLEAFCHLWRNLGYQLGIEDEYNLCRGTLEDVRQRGRELVDTWIKPNLREITPEWEHMSRCLFVTFSNFFPFFTFEMSILHLMETLDLVMPRLFTSFSYVDRFVYRLTTGLLHYGMKVPGVTSLVNAVVNLILNQAEKYTPSHLESLRIKLGE